MRSTLAKYFKVKECIAERMGVSLAEPIKVDSGTLELAIARTINSNNPRGHREGR